MRPTSIAAALLVLGAALGATPALADDKTEAPSKENASAEPDKPKLEPAKGDKPDQPSEPTAHRYPPTGVRWALIGGGSILTLGAYGGSLAAAFGWPDVQGADKLKIPFIGPWWALAQVGCSTSNPSCGALKYVRGVLEGLDGVVQLAGLPLIGEGIFMTTEAPSKEEPKKAALIQSMGLIPVVSPTTTGLQIVGRF